MSFISKAARSDIGSGIAIALLSLTYTLSYGALTTTSITVYWLYNYGCSNTTVVTGLAVAYLSKIKFSIAGQSQCRGGHGGAVFSCFAEP